MASTAALSDALSGVFSPAGGSSPSSSSSSSSSPSSFSSPSSSSSLPPPGGGSLGVFGGSQTYTTTSLPIYHSATVDYDPVTTATAADATTVNFTVLTGNLSTSVSRLSTALTTNAIAEAETSTSRSILEIALEITTNLLGLGGGTSPTPSPSGGSTSRGSAGGPPVLPGDFSAPTTDSPVGAILQVLLHQGAHDVTTSSAPGSAAVSAAGDDRYGGVYGGGDGSDSGGIVGGGGDGGIVGRPSRLLSESPLVTESVVAVTSDMQYSAVTNLTNVTIELLANGTYLAADPLGGIVGSGAGGPSGVLVDVGGTSVLPVSQYRTHESVLIGLLLSLIIFFSVAGNVVVCAAILSDRNLRKTSNYFIISLAVADMLVASMVMSFAVANDILGYWVFGEMFCSVWISLDIMCSTASILNLCAISLDRYLHIRSPLHYETSVTPSCTLLCISAVWVLSALMSFVPIHLGWHQLGLTPEPTLTPPSPSTTTTTTTRTTAATTLTTPPSSSSSPPLPAADMVGITASEPFICMMELNPWYAVVSSMVSFYLPCLVMIAIYLRLYAYARRHVDAIKMQTRTPMLQQNGSGHGGSMSSSAAGGKTAAKLHYKVADHKAAITLGVIMGTFLFCWTPFFTINIVGAFCKVCIPTVVFQIFTWLGYFNSTLNPIIYSIFNKEFREAFKRVLSFRRCHCFGCRQEAGDFRRPIKYTETGAYGTVRRKNDSFASFKDVTAV